MSTKGLSIAFAIAIIALPVPASQMLAAAAPPVAAPGVTIVAGDANLRLLLEDPFLIDRLSHAVPASFVELDRPLL